MQHIHVTKYVVRCIILVNYPFFLIPPLEFQSTRSNFRIYIYIPVHLTSEMKKNRRESREEGSIVSQGPLTSFQLLSPRPWPKRHFNRRRRPPPLVSKPPIKSKGESLVEFSDAVPLLLPSPPPAPAQVGGWLHFAPEQCPRVSRHRVPSLDEHEDLPVRGRVEEEKGPSIP